MASKTRFNKSSAAGGPIVSGSKKTNVGIGSGFAPVSYKAPSNVQVIYNGKIVTPVSLLARPKVPSNTFSSAKGDAEVKGTSKEGNETPVVEEEKNKQITKKDSMTSNRSR